MKSDARREKVDDRRWCEGRKEEEKHEEEEREYSCDFGSGCEGVFPPQQRCGGMYTALSDAGSVEECADTSRAMLRLYRTENSSITDRGFWYSPMLLYSTPS